MQFSALMRCQQIVTIDCQRSLQSVQQLPRLKPSFSELAVLFICLGMTE